MFSIAVIGGDERARRLADVCRAQGHPVTTLGLWEGDETTATVENMDVLLFPYPFSVKHTGIPNLQGLTIDPADILARAKEGAFLLAGEGAQPYIAAVQALGKSLTCRQYQDDPVFLQDNADISAEGAIAYAMQQTDCTIAGISVLVIGYGLFGRAIAQKLRHLEADVTVAARSESARLQARSDGMRAIELSELRKEVPSVQLVMNTVPAPVLDDAILMEFPAEALLMELASAPYGFDLEAAKRFGLAAVLLPGIPARYAPQSAAKALYEAMRRLLLTKRGESV